MALLIKAITQRMRLLLKFNPTLSFGKVYKSKKKYIFMLSVSSVGFIGTLLCMKFIFSTTPFSPAATTRIFACLILSSGFYIHKGIQVRKKMRQKKLQNMHTINQEGSLIPITNNFDLIIYSMKVLPLFIMTTDTVPGLFCRLQDSSSAKRIFALKKRGNSKPLSIYTTNFNPFIIKEALSKKFLKYWNQNSITLVLKASSNAPSIAVKEGFVGIRIIEKSHPTALVLKKSGLSLLGTSANLSGNKEPTKLSEISSEILNEAPIITPEEKESFSFSLPSSVLKIDGRKISILREGKNIEKILSWIHKMKGIETTDLSNKNKIKTFII